MIDFEINAAGHLVVTADADGREHIADRVEQDGPATVWAELCEHESCNGGFTPAVASDLGHMSEAPVIVESADYPDSGGIEAVGRVWYLADYMVRDELRDLQDGKAVTFTLLKGTE